MTDEAFKTLNLGVTTPGRRTTVVLDVAEEALVERAIYIARKAEDIARTTASRLENVRLVEGIGWQLSPVPRTDDASDPDDGLGPTELQTSSRMAFLATQPGGRSKMLQKQVPAGSPSTSSLTADAAAAPGPGGASKPMDRIARTNGNHPVGRAITHRILHPAGTQTPDVIQTLQFPAPPTTIGTADDPYAKGTGQWSLKFYGTGEAELIEERFAVPGTDRYWRVATAKGAIRWAPRQGASGQLHEVEIVVRTDPTRQADYGGVISISSHQAETDPGLLALPRPADAQTFVYRIREQFDPGETAHPLRVDERNDLRPLSQTAPAKYRMSGLLIGDPFISEGPVGLGDAPETGSTLRLSWRFDPVAGGNIVGDLLKNDNTIASPVGSGSDGTTFWKLYSVNDLAPANNGYGIPPTRPQFTFTGGGEGTPTLTFCRLTKAPVIEIVEAGEKPCDGTRGTPTPTIQGLQQGNDDPGLDSGTLNLFDESGLFTPVKDRGEFTVEVRTAVSPLTGGPAVTTVLFEGRAIVSGTAKVGAHDPDDRHAAGDAQETSLALLGPWARLEEAYAPQILDFSVSKDGDAAAGLPWKVTDAISIALGFAGVPERGADIPDIPSVRFDPGEDGAKLEAGASLTDFIRRSAREKLGAVIVKDPNAKKVSDPGVPRGLWRLVRPPVAPYRPLFAILLSPQADAQAVGAIDVASLLSYPGIVVNGQTLPATFAERGTLRGRVIRPEANLITVVGGASDGKGGRVSTTFVNPKSYRAVRGQSPPSADGNPDYLGHCVELRLVESKLQTQGAVWFAARRLFDTIGHGRPVKTLTAPLILITDPQDPHQIAPRPPRLGDVSLVEGEDGELTAWVVRRVQMGTEKDHAQSMDLELERLPLDRKWQFGRAIGPRGILLSARRRATGRDLGQKLYDTPITPGEGVSKLYSGEVEGLPVIQGFSPQNLDPSSETFGQPTFLAGYDDV